MPLGLHPHWGSTLTNQKVGEWSTFALNNGFEVLEFTVDFRMLENGLHRVLDKRIVNTLDNARGRGLKLHIAAEPYEAPLCSDQPLYREEGIRRLSQILKYLETVVRPHFVFLHPGQSRGKTEWNLSRLIESYQLLQERFPRLRLGLKVGEEGACLKTPAEIRRLTSIVREADFVLDLGWAFAAAEGDFQKVGNLLQALSRNLFEIHWHNLRERPRRRRLPLGQGDLREKQLLKIFGLLPAPRSVWHILDYRDRGKQHYLSDKLIIEEMAFRSTRVGS